MKTNQLILAAALIALAACNKENVDNNVGKLDGEEIGFNVVNQRATKANDAIITGTTYGTDNTFKVWGWQSEGGAFAEFADAAASNFMSNLTISWTGGRLSRAEAWRNADNYYYWPFTGKISFLAVHPSTVAPTTTGWDATNLKPQATVADYTISDANKTVDLMFANNEGSRRSDALPMVFSHALSQIQFRVRTNEDYSADVTFKVNSVTINNIDLSGDLAYANDAFTWTDNAAQTASWPYYATTATVAYHATDADADLYGDANVMIPQAANADDPATTDVLEGTTLTINYTMEPVSGAAITGDVTVGAGQEWLEGKKYVYTLNFKLNEILFNPSVTDWVVVNVDTINILD
ncbi:MAG: fimbrillin family protein [Bacteroidales bacterium]|nr:fimbrillin family protein [Bacteroidales bacterium]